jgi:hypothetical protein
MTLEPTIFTDETGREYLRVCNRCNGQWSDLAECHICGSPEFRIVYDPLYRVDVTGLDDERECMGYAVKGGLRRLVRQVRNAGWGKWTIILKRLHEPEKPEIVPPVVKVKRKRKKKQAELFA